VNDDIDCATGRAQQFAHPAVKVPDVLCFDPRYTT